MLLPKSRKKRRSRFQHHNVEGKGHLNLLSEVMYISSQQQSDDEIGLFPAQWKENLSEFGKDKKQFVINPGILRFPWYKGVVALFQCCPKLLFNILQPAINSIKFTDIYYIKLWQFGKWRFVRINDSLPVHRGTKNLIYSSHRYYPKRFWFPLLEKAYAELLRSYEDLNFDISRDALVDFSGGIVEEFQLLAIGNAKKLFLILLQARMHHSIMITSKLRESYASCNNNYYNSCDYELNGIGFCFPHDTALHASTDLVDMMETVNLDNLVLRLKSVCYDSSNDQDPSIMRCLSTAERAANQLFCNDDQEFWITFNNWITIFTNITLIHFDGENHPSNDFSNEPLARNTCSIPLPLKPNDKEHPLKFGWRLETFQGFWQKQVSGAFAKHQIGFWKNPQYYLNITTSDIVTRQSVGSCIITLMVHRDPEETYHFGSELFRKLFV
ncbi:hypothetical protein SNEBB_011488 [Seison nebaliae]|nr:hypothetical protein SNEBB_011488 [Seison nebaliae]